MIVRRIDSFHCTGFAVFCTVSLTASSILESALSLLPTNDGTVKLATPIEALELIVHAIHTQTGFRLVSPASDPDSSVANRLPSNWTRDGTPTKLKYKHDQSSLEFVVSVVELGGRAMLAAVAVQVRSFPRFPHIGTISAHELTSRFPCGTESKVMLVRFTSDGLLVKLVVPSRLASVIHSR